MYIILGFLGLGLMMLCCGALAVFSEEPGRMYDLNDITTRNYYTLFGKLGFCFLVWVLVWVLPVISK